MLIKIMKWFRGYLLIEMSGYSPERFINLCRNKNILLWELRKTQQGYSFFMSLDGYRQIRPIARKTRTWPLIQKRYGLPFLFSRYKKRKSFFTGIFLGVAILYFLSLFIWDITLEGQYTHTEEVMIKYLKEISVYPGILKNKIDCKNIEENIRKKYTDIGWVSAEIKGTRLHIKITETNMPALYETQVKESHIIADHDGIVTSIVTRKGTPLVKKGDVVKKGDILISGIVPILGDGDVLIKNNIVAADGDVMLKTTYDYKDSFPLTYQKKIYTGESKEVYGISLFEQNLFFYNPLKKFLSFEKYDIIVDEKNFTLGKNFVLPITWIKKEYQEYSESTKKYTKNEAEAIAQEKINLYLEKIIEKKVLIHENNVKILVGNSECVAEGKLVVEEKQAQHREIKEDEWRITNSNEYNGDNN